MRKLGFYWVLCGEDMGGQWTVARWDAGFIGSWNIVGNEIDFSDSEFVQIDERIITRD